MKFQSLVQSFLFEQSAKITKYYSAHVKSATAVPS